MMNKIRKLFACRDVDKDSLILEIGPLCFPMYPKSDGFNVEIADYLSGEELRQKYKDSIGYDADKIEEVDFVVARHYASSIGKKGYYDVIAASHLIEHVVDIIEFINDCSTLLKNDGKIKLVIPDKRYEFDYFREEVSIRTVIDNHYYRTSANNHSIGTRIDTLLNSVHVKGNGTYVPNSGIYFDKDMMFSWDDNNDWLDDMVLSIKEYSDDKYCNMHSGVFTPKSFEILIYQLNILGYIDFKIDEIITEKNSIEFYVTLKRGKEKFEGKHLAELQIQHKKEMFESFSNYEELMKAVLAKKRLFIYGTGKASDRIVRFLELLQVTYEGHIVSNGHKDKEYCHEHKIYELADIEKEQDVCVLLGVSVQFREEVCRQLEGVHMEYIF